MNGTMPVSQKNLTAKYAKDDAQTMTDFFWRHLAYSRLISFRMEKPNVRGASPSRKAHFVLRDKLNRKSKPPPLLPSRPGEVPEPARRPREDRK
jgi:hypothetical protein